MIHWLLFPNNLQRHGRPFRGCIYLAQGTFLEGLKGGNLEEAEVFTSTAPSPFISCLPCFWGADVSTVLDHINQPLGCLLGSQVSWPKAGLSSKSESRGATGCRWGPNERCRGSWIVWGISQSLCPLHLGHCKLVGSKTFFKLDQKIYWWIDCEWSDGRAKREIKVLVDDGAIYLDGESLRERYFVRKINKFLLDWWHLLSCPSLDLRGEVLFGDRNLSHCHVDGGYTHLHPGGSVVTKLPANAGDTEDAHSIPGLGIEPTRDIGWSRKQQPTPVFLPGKSHGWRSLVNYMPQGDRESDNWARTHVDGKVRILVVNIEEKRSVESKEEMRQNFWLWQDVHHCGLTGGWEAKLPH